MMHGSQPGNEDAESENDGGDFRGSADQGGNRSGRAVIHVGHPHMERYRAEFERNGDDDKHQTQFQQPFVSFFIEGRGEHAGKFQRTGCAVNHRNTVEQQAGCQRAQNKIFQGGFGGKTGIAAQGNQGVKGERQEFQTDIGS